MKKLSRDNPQASNKDPHMVPAVRPSEGCSFDVAPCITSVKERQSTLRIALEWLQVRPSVRVGPAFFDGAWTMDNETYQPCIEACDTCAAACDRCVSACLSEPRVQSMAKCIRLNADCASLCRLTSAALARQSHFAPEFCVLCARICDECADECSRHAPEHCGTCSDACRRCAEACRAIEVQFS